MMLKIINISLLIALSCSISACGVKGSLKTPAQIEKDAAKKSAKEAKKQQEQQDTQEQK